MCNRTVFGFTVGSCSVSQCVYSKHRSKVWKKCVCIGYRVHNVTLQFNYECWTFTAIKCVCFNSRRTSEGNSCSRVGALNATCDVVENEHKNSENIGDSSRFICWRRIGLQAIVPFLSSSRSSRTVSTGVANSNAYINICRKPKFRDSSLT